jgi:hypothetical protein
MTEGQISVSLSKAQAYLSVVRNDSKAFIGIYKFLHGEDK